MPEQVAPEAGNLLGPDLGVYVTTVRAGGGARLGVVRVAEGGKSLGEAQSAACVEQGNR